MTQPLLCLQMGSSLPFSALLLITFLSSHGSGFTLRSSYSSSSYPLSSSWHNRKARGNWLLRDESLLGDDDSNSNGISDSRIRHKGRNNKVSQTSSSRRDQRLIGESGKSSTITGSSSSGSSGSSGSSPTAVWELSAIYRSFSTRAARKDLAGIIALLLDMAPAIAANTAATYTSTTLNDGSEDAPEITNLGDRQSSSDNSNTSNTSNASNTSSSSSSSSSSRSSDDKKAVYTNLIDDPMAAVCTEGFLQLALQDGTDGWLAVSTLKALQQTVLRAVTADSGPLTSAYASSESQFQSGPESSPSTTSWATRAGRKYAPAVTEAVGLATCEMLAAMCLKALVQVEYAWNMLGICFIFIIYFRPHESSL